MSSSSPRPTKAERTQEARDKAKALREKHNESVKRKKFLTRLAVVIVPVIILVIVAIVIVGNQKSAPKLDNSAAPANTTTNGVLVGKDNKVITGEVPVNEDGKKPVSMVLYQDYMCPACNQLETSYADQIKELRDSGIATVEYRTITFLDPQSQGTNYSSRAANAAACVINTAPDKFVDFNTALYANQPKEGTTGLTNARLAEIAKEAGIPEVENCIKDGTYRGWAAANQKTGIEKVSGTPSIFVNDVEWDRKVDFINMAKEAYAKQ